MVIVVVVVVVVVALAHSIVGVDDGDAAIDIVVVNAVVVTVVDSVLNGAG